MGDDDLRTAVIFLWHQLAAGPRPVLESFQAADKVGIPRHLIYRVAVVDLKLDAFRGEDGLPMWQLSDQEA